MASRAALIFRVAAVAEALSWAALLIGMFTRDVLEAGNPVPVVGMTHGIVFVVYVLVTLAVAKPLGWKFGTVFWALVASVPPLFTWFFEKWALRRGKLDGPQRLTHGGTGLFVRQPVSV
ncbi:DUF3817 domain-containing protein [Amycolatopsis suaedae]|uniref:DUF3817 domain-containing protein n=1 Tax=Amycolatopsis suaedae TaxID=2510978 RepID=A0A4V2EKX4_9PSEU|nr:DUF3817 domain-containing protein [Amycolatopsis suaedae]RZQ59575.1 DUF3817 domain-containing protein [Amycolatopsis suaedae]